MRDLLELDGIPGSEGVRPLRKAQVSEIQSLMDTMDMSAQRLRAIRNDLEKDAEAARQEAEEEEERKRKEQEAAEAEARERRKKALENLDWTQLKLSPQLHIQQRPSAYVISGHVPGLDREKIVIELTEDGTGLVVGGVRLPTKPEVDGMLQTLDGPRIPPALKSLDRASALFRLGAGRFGRFTQVFELPEDVVREKIEADYTRGVLTVTIPRVQLRPRPRPSPPQRTHPMFGDFFGNQDDMWW
jgi:HSP20 family molecular chaperone IbpA